MSKVLLTGFGPYGHTPVNPAESVARALDGQVVEGAEVVSRIVPNNFFESIDVVAAAIAEVRPAVVVMLGEYGGRAMLTVERLAQNLNDSTRYDLADNRGVRLQGELTVPDGPAAYYATVPLRAMVRAMRAAGIPADISDTAATFGCNHLMYGVLHHIATKKLPIRAGWIHLPHLPSVAALEENLAHPACRPKRPPPASKPPWRPPSRTTKISTNRSPRGFRFRQVSSAVGLPWSNRSLRKQHHAVGDGTPGRWHTRCRPRPGLCTSDTCASDRSPGPRGPRRPAAAWRVRGREPETGES